MTLNFEGDIEKIIDADEPVDGDPVDNLGSDKTNGSSETNDTSEIASSSETNTEAASDTEVTYGRENAGTAEILYLCRMAPGYGNTRTVGNYTAPILA